MGNVGGDGKFMLLHVDRAEIITVRLQTPIRLLFSRINLLRSICRPRIQVHHDDDDEPDTSMVTEIWMRCNLVQHVHVRLSGSLSTLTFSSGNSKQARETHDLRDHASMHTKAMSDLHRHANHAYTRILSVERFLNG